MIENMFETAIRNKYRYPYKGEINTEDLWDLGVEDLDRIYKSLNSQLKQADEESLLDKTIDENKELEIQIEIIKHIVKTKLDEQELKEKSQERKEQKQRILEILKAKQDESLQNKTEEELLELLDKL